MLSAFGYGYATLRQIRRAERARALIAGGMGLGRVAADAGYADQAHMCRDFARLVGASPARIAVRRAQNALPSSTST